MDAFDDSNNNEQHMPMPMDAFDSNFNQSPPPPVDYESPFDSAGNDDNLFTQPDPTSVFQSEPILPSPRAMEEPVLPPPDQMLPEEGSAFREWRRSVSPHFMHSKCNIHF